MDEGEGAINLEWSAVLGFRPFCPAAKFDLLPVYVFRVHVHRDRVIAARPSREILGGVLGLVGLTVTLALFRNLRRIHLVTARSPFPQIIWLGRPKTFVLLTTKGHVHPIGRYFSWRETWFVPATAPDGRIY